MLCDFLSELGVHGTISMKSFLQFFILQKLTPLVLLVVHQLLIFSVKDILLHCKDRADEPRVVGSGRVSGSGRGFL